jgi:hypothetical protein
MSGVSIEKAIPAIFKIPPILANISKKVIC